jgi:hypothetical protein
MSEETLMGLLAAKNKKKKVSLERTPREIAEDHAYQCRKTKECYIPAGYVTGAFAYAAAEYKQTGSKKSYKAIAAGIFRPTKEEIVLIDEKNEPIKNFEVDIRKGTNFTAGAVAVCRPRFDKWEAEFHVMLNTDLISEAMALQILSDAGVRAGIGSFRVQKSGWFGQFSVSHFKEFKEKLKH